MIKYTFWSNELNNMARFSPSVKPLNPGLQLRSLARLSKVGIFTTLVGCSLLYGWDRYQQHQARLLFNTTRPQGGTDFVIKNSIDSAQLDSWNYNEEHSLADRYGEKSLVKIGGGRKEMLKGTIPYPQWMEPSYEIRPSSTPLDESAFAHVSLVIEPDRNTDTNYPLIIGSQSPTTPVMTLLSALKAGWQQLLNPVEGLSMASVMSDEMKTTIGNETPFIAEGSSFDTMLINDLAIPVAFVDDALIAAKDNLNPVMTVVTSNCITTKTYVLLKLAQRVDAWAQSDASNAPTRAQANSFIHGCYEIIDLDIHARGYGVLNNELIVQELKTLSEITRKISKDEEVKTTLQLK